MWFLFNRYGKIFYRHAALFFFLRPPSPHREGARHVNRIMTSQSLLAKGSFATLVAYLHGRTQLYYIRRIRSNFEDVKSGSIQTNRKQPPERTEEIADSRPYRPLHGGRHRLPCLYLFAGGSGDGRCAGCPDD